MSRELLQQALDACILDAAGAALAGCGIPGQQVDEIAPQVLDLLQREFKSYAAIREQLAQPPSEPACPSCGAPGLLCECVHCGHSNYPAAPAPAAPEQKLSAHAMVGGGIFRAGVPERLVIEAAYRQYEAHEAEGVKTQEERQTDERNRRMLWDQIHGAPASPPPVALSDAVTDVLAERRRQVEKEGWDSAHDDDHADGSLAEAAACYATALPETPMPFDWPWDSKWWKPKDNRRNMVRAAALLLAEIERLDRAAPAPAVPSCHVSVIGHRFDDKRQVHIPQVLLEFEPVPIGSPNDAKGWMDRDAMANLLIEAPPSTQPVALTPLHPCGYENPKVQVCNKCGQLHDKPIFGDHQAHGITAHTKGTP